MDPDQPVQYTEPFENQVGFHSEDVNAVVIDMKTRNNLKRVQAQSQNPGRPAKGASHQITGKSYTLLRTVSRENLVNSELSKKIYDSRPFQS